MNFIQKNKTIIIAVVLFALAIWVYGTFIKPSNTGLSTDKAAQQVGGDVLDLYASLQAVQLDQTLFSTPLYRHLVDFSTDIPAQPIGRTNPFDDIGK